MCDWTKTKDVKIEKPFSCTTVDEQKDIYNNIVAYWCWLLMRTDINQQGILYTKSLVLQEYWCEQFPILFEKWHQIINESYEEILQRFGCEMLFKSTDNILGDATFYFDLVRAMASKPKKPCVEKKYLPVKEWVGNRDTEGMEGWQSGIWVDKCAFFNYPHYCSQAEKIDEQKIKMDREEKAFVRAVVKNIQK
ncbi:Hypothetical predicted protein [Paramuricea clavata]|uniref:Uncharacterized protein n=1 Tax=Paramuricea clavata TaxID=317549 RepID=A0A7D9D8L4_PARCT|nr:Hypothetical predicted protein [Paramuricea clavata]